MSSPINLARPVGPPVDSNRVADRQGASASSGPQARKLRKATEEFESMLVSSWWEQMEKTFGNSEPQEPGFDTLRSIGLRAMTTAMAAAGGFGIARMLYHKLEPELSHGQVQQNH